MEEAAKYQTGARTYEIRECNCQQCGNLLGIEVESNKKVYLKRGNGLDVHVTSYCSVCGVLWHWGSAERTLQRIIKRPGEIERQAKNDLTELSETVRKSLLTT